jgi:hypothetical protein
MASSKRQPQRGAGIIPIERIAASIYVIRGQKVMLDADLAALYGVETRVFNQAVRRNRDRFPDDFLFQLTEEEAKALRSQIVTLEPGRGRYPKYAPLAFTEQGVAMLSSVLRSKRAVQVNISIMRAFVRIRQVLATSEELARKVAQHDRQIAVLFEHVQKLLAPPPVKKNPIGFIRPQDE